MFRVPLYGRKVRIRDELYADSTKIQGGFSGIRIFPLRKGSHIARRLCVWARAVSTLLIDHDEARLEHVGDGILGLLASLLFRLELDLLLLEFINELELLLNGLGLGQGSGLLFQDLLLGASALGCDFHSIEQDKSQERGQSTKRE